MSYEEAKEKLKYLEDIQKVYKKGRCNNDKSIREKLQTMVEDKKIEINEILTIIHLHKQSRKLWAEANKKHEYGYMCKVDFDHELGCALGGNTIYPSLKDLKKHHSECHFGSVKVKVSLEEVIRDEDVTGRSCE